MNKGAIIFFVVVVFTIVFSVWYSTNQSIQMDDSDDHGLPRGLPLILPNLKSISPLDNLTKGMTLTCNFTVTSVADKELVVPLELKLYKITSGHGNEIGLEEAGFYEYYAPTVFVLDSFRSLSSLVTLEISEDVEISKYQLKVVTVNWEETNVGGATLNFEVVG